jgi:D-alanyl-D-alanine carboxypeptidase
MRTAWRLAGLVLLFSAPAVVAATCRAGAVYEGRAPRDAIALPALETTGPKRPDAALAARLDAAFAQAAERTSAPAIAAAVMIAEGSLWSAQRPQGPVRLHYWASAGKTLTAVAILQLMEEGRLGLDDPVSRWVSNVPDGNLITVRHLLEHRSGLFSVNEDESWRAAPAPHDVAQVIEVARRHGRLFCAGTNWRYSNSNYVLLGAIIERIDERPLAEALEDRIVRRAGLEEIRILTPGADLSNVAPLASPAGTPIDMRWPGAAGPVAASPAAMIGFWRALFGGRLLSRATVEAMFTRLYPMFGDNDYYGLGVSAVDVPMPAGGSDLWLGHLGGLPGANAIIAFSTRRRAFVAVALTGDGPAPAAANLLIQTLDEGAEGPAE